jgi:drug/metabolite transporter (DMT)-like permease
MNLSNTSKAIILGAIASILWSTVFVAGRYLCDVMGMAPSLVAFLRFSIAGFGSMLYIILKGETKSLKVLFEKPVTIILLGFIGIFGMGTAVFLALKYSTAVDVSIIMNSNAVFITPLAILVGESLTFVKISGIIIGLLGCALVINGRITGFELIGGEHLAGNLIAIISALCWAIYTVMGKKIVRDRGGLVVTSLNMVVGSIPLFLLSAGLGQLTLPPLKGFLIIAYLAIFPTAIGFVFWYKALENIDASQLGPLQYLVPVGTAIISIFTLNEPIKPASIVGMLLVFLGIYLSTVKRKSYIILTKNEHPPIA